MDEGRVVKIGDRDFETKVTSLFVYLNGTSYR